MSARRGCFLSIMTALVGVLWIAFAMYGARGVVLVFALLAVGLWCSEILVRWLNRWLDSWDEITPETRARILNARGRRG